MAFGSIPEVQITGANIAAVDDHTFEHGRGVDHPKLQRVHASLVDRVRGPQSNPTAQMALADQATSCLMKVPRDAWSRLCVATASFPQARLKTAAEDFCKNNV